MTYSNLCYLCIFVKSLMWFCENLLDFVFLKTFMRWLMGICVNLRIFVRSLTWFCIVQNFNRWLTQICITYAFLWNHLCDFVKIYLILCFSKFLWDDLREICVNLHIFVRSHVNLWKLILFRVENFIGWLIRICVTYAFLLNHLRDFVKTYLILYPS